MACSKPSRKTKMMEVLECGICLSVLVDPKTLPCLHTYCSECMKQVVKVKQNGVSGVVCPKCRVFSPAGKYVSLFIIIDFLDVYRHSTSGDAKQKCHLCTEESAEWRCLNCKINLCIRCQQLHKKTPNCKDHKYVTVDEEGRYLIDKNIDCDEHPDQVMNLYCVSCRRCICFFCKATTHTGHRTEMIDVAAAKLMEQMVANLQDIKYKIHTLSTESSNIEMEQKSTIASYKAAEDLFRQMFKDAVRKLEQELETRIQELNRQQVQENEKFQSVKEENGAMINDLRIKVMLATATLQNTQGSSLIRALEQGELQQKISDEAMKIPTPTVMNVKRPWHLPNYTIQNGQYLLGETAYKDEKVGFKVPEYFNGRRVERSFQNDLEQMQLVITFDVKGKPWRIGLVNDRLWISEFDVESNPLEIGRWSGKRESELGYVFQCPINIHNTDGVILKTLKMGLIKGATDLVKINKSEVIVVSHSGIYVLTTDGEIKYTITDDCYEYISTDGEKVAAAGAKNVVIITQIEGRWQIQHQFQLSHSKLYKTIHLHNDVINIGGKDQGHIHRYSLDGKLNQEVCFMEKSELWLRVCGSDTHGSLICCDYVSNSLHIVSRTGDWCTVTLDGVSPIRDVCVMGGHVYVLHGKWDDTHFKVSKFAIRNA